MTYSQLVSKRFAISFILCVSLLFGCTTSQRMDASLAEKYDGFIRDGQTTKLEVETRLGSAHSMYEQGRILIYRVYLLEDGRMNLKGIGDCHVCVLVFDKDGVVERHSIIKHGCR
jgi:hypothetical protein